MSLLKSGSFSKRYIISYLDEHPDVMEEVHRRHWNKHKRFNVDSTCTLATWAKMNGLMLKRLSSGMRFFSGGYYFFAGMDAVANRKKQFWEDTFN